MVAIPASARPILEGPNLAHVVTIDPDGAPQVSCVWVGLDGRRDRVRLARAVAQAAQPPAGRRVALSVESPELNHLGMREYLVLQGTARVETGGAPEVLQELAHVYIGPDVRFPPMDDPPPGSVVRITVDRVGGVGPWTTDAPSAYAVAGSGEDAVDEVRHALGELVPSDQLPIRARRPPGRRWRRTSS